MMPVVNHAFQARWNDNNAVLSPSYISPDADLFQNMACTVTNAIREPFLKLFRPFNILIGKQVLPASEYSCEEKRRVKEAWEKRWLSADSLYANPLKSTYTAEPIAVTSPDGIDLGGVFYRNKHAPSNDVPTIVVFNPNMGLCKMEGADWILKKGIKSSIPYNVVVFDYRGCGESSGALASGSELLLDGESVFQFVRDYLHVSEHNIHFFGRSLGGGVSTVLQGALHPEIGNSVNGVSFSSICRLIEVSKFVDIIVAHLATQSKLIQKIHSPELVVLVKKITCAVLRFLDWDIDALRAWNKVKERSLVVWHPKDALIIEDASLGRPAEEIYPEHAERLSFKDTVTCKSKGSFDHHNAPLHIYQSPSGLNATKRILIFLLETDLFKRNRGPSARKRYVIN